MKIKYSLNLLYKAFIKNKDFHFRQLYFKMAWNLRHNEEIILNGIILNVPKEDEKEVIDFLQIEYKIEAIKFYALFSKI